MLLEMKPQQLKEKLAKLQENATKQITKDLKTPENQIKQEANSKETEVEAIVIDDD